MMAPLIKIMATPESLEPNRCKLTGLLADFILTHAQGIRDQCNRHWSSQWGTQRPAVRLVNQVLLHKHLMRKTALVNFMYKRKFQAHFANNMHISD